MSKKITKKKPPINHLAEAKKLIAAKEQEALTKCAAEIKEILEKYNCTITIPPSRMIISIKK